jgi:diacylglycerol kinase (ATP)
LTAKVIFNPYAGRWLAREKLGEVHAALKQTGIEYELEMTEGPGHGIELASRSVKAGYSPIISAGGDGSINEVVNGMVDSVENMTNVPLGIIPLGSANDLVDNLKLPRDINQAVKIIANGSPRAIDLCQVNQRYFVNNAAIGLEPYITLIQQRITRFRGNFRYLTATLLGVFDNPKWLMDLEWDNGSYSGPATLVTVGNSPRTGGLFYMTPHADPFDGKLTFVYGYMATRIEILRLLPRTLKPEAGSYVEHPAIHEISSTLLKIRTSSPTPAHADGEIFSESVQELEYRVFPGGIQLLM